MISIQLKALCEQILFCIIVPAKTLYEVTKAIYFFIDLRKLLPNDARKTRLRHELDENEIVCFILV